MRTTPDTSPDTLPTLGPAIRPPAPAPTPTPADTFASGNWAPKGLVITPEPASTLSDEERAGLADAQAVIADWLEF